MAFEISVERRPGFTRVTVTGAAALADLLGAITDLAGQTLRLHETHVLVDLTGVQGRLSFTDHFQLGDHAARELKHLKKLASVVPADKITRTSEKVARKQGLQLQVFVSVDEAIDWLTADTAAT